MTIENLLDFWQKTGSVTNRVTCKEIFLLMAYKSVMNEKKKLEPESDLFGTPKKYSEDH